MYQFRPYDAETGRWLSRDAIGEEGGFNLYAFVDNDPISGIDLLGFDRIEVGSCGEVTWVVESTTTTGGGCTRCKPVRTRRIDIGTLPLKTALFGLTTKADGDVQLVAEYTGGKIPLKQLKKAAQHVHEWFGDISGFIIPAQDVRIIALINNPTKPTEFGTQDEAATWACWFAYKKQQETGWEWAGFIYQAKGGKFAIGAPRTDKHPTQSFPGGVAFFETAVGWYHTHPSGERFSDLDHSMTRFLKRITKDRSVKVTQGYVGVPSGKVLGETGSSYSGTYVVSPK
jgi:hypothetical protein